MTYNFVTTEILVYYTHSRELAQKGTVCLQK